MNEHAEPKPTTCRVSVVVFLIVPLHFFPSLDVCRCAVTKTAHSYCRRRLDCYDIFFSLWLPFGQFSTYYRCGFHGYSYVCVCVLNNNNSGRSIAMELIVLRFAIEWIARLRSMRSLGRTVPTESMNGRMNTSVIIAAERLHVCIIKQTHNRLHINSSCLHSFSVAFAKAQYKYSLAYVYRFARNNHMEGFDDAMHATIFMWSHGFFQLYGSVG